MKATADEAREAEYVPSHRYQEQSLFFKLPLELRLLIYQAAIPSFTQRQYIRSKGPDPRLLGDVEATPIRCDPTCMPVVDALGGRMRMAHYRSPQRYPSEYQSPLPLLHTCRGFYGEVLSLSYESFRSSHFVDLASLKAFLDTKPDWMLGYLRDMVITMKVTHDVTPMKTFRESLVPMWKATCTQLASLPRLEHLKVQLECHVNEESDKVKEPEMDSMIKELDGVAAANVWDLEVQKVLVQSGIGGMRHCTILRPAAPAEELNSLNSLPNIPGWKAVRVRRF